MKYFYKSFISIILLLIIASNVYADIGMKTVYEGEDANGNWSCTYKVICSPEKYDYALVLVLRPGVTMDQIINNDSEVFSYVKYIDQVDDIENGYEFQITMDKEDSSGEYSVLINTKSESGQSIKRLFFYHISYDDRKTIMDKVNNASNVTSILDVLKEQKPTLMSIGCSYKFYNSCDKNKLAEILLTSKPANGYTDLEFVNTFNWQSAKLYINQVTETNDMKDAIEVINNKFSNSIYNSDTRFASLADKNFVYQYLIEHEEYETLNDLIIAFKEAMNMLFPAPSPSPSPIITPSPSPSHKHSSSSSGNKYIPKPTASALPSPTIQPTSEPSTNEKVEIPDLEGFDWAKNAIDNLTELGVIKGAEDSKFYPNEPITREQFVKMLVYALDLPKGSNKISFNDVSTTDWFYDSIVSAVNNNIINGIDESTFGIGLQIKRQDAAVMIYRALNLQLTIDSGISFSDSSEISKYALEPVKSVSQNKLMNGMSDGTFMPLANLRRAEAAVIIDRLLKLRNKEKTD